MTCCTSIFQSHNNSGLIILVSIMPPGVPHWVMGTSNSICTGRHFYAASTIRLSVISIVHTFLFAGAVVNEDHLETRTLLHQMMVFWSMRLDQTDVDGRRNLLKQHFGSNYKTLQGHIFRTYPLRKEFSTSYTLEYSSSSPLLSIDAFMKAQTLLPFSWRSKTTPFVIFFRSSTRS